MRANPDTKKFWAEPSADEVFLPRNPVTKVACCHFGPPRMTKVPMFESAKFVGWPKRAEKLATPNPPGTKKLTGPLAYTLKTIINLGDDIPRIGLLDASGNAINQPVWIENPSVEAITTPAQPR